MWLLYWLSSFCIIVTVTISYHIPDNYSESACTVWGWYHQHGPHVDSVDSRGAHNRMLIHTYPHIQVSGHTWSQFLMGYWEWFIATQRVFGLPILSFYRLPADYTHTHSNCTHCSNNNLSISQMFLGRVIGSRIAINLIYSVLHVRLESKSHEKLFVLVVNHWCHAAGFRSGNCVWIV